MAAAQTQPEQAARLFGVAGALRDAINAPRPPAFRSYHERNLAAVRDRLGEEAFEKAWAEGWAMSPEQAIEYALSQPATPNEEDTHPPASAAAVLRIFALGPARVEKDGRPLTSLPLFVLSGYSSQVTPIGVEDGFSYLCCPMAREESPLDLFGGSDRS